jgi:hypothetical protein
VSFGEHGSKIYGRSIEGRDAHSFSIFEMAIKHVATSEDAHTGEAVRGTGVNCHRNTFDRYATQVVNERCGEMGSNGGRQDSDRGAR